MWTKLNEVGSKMISLSRSFSEISRGCFRAQVSGSVHVNAKDAKVEASLLFRHAFVFLF